MTTDQPSPALCPYHNSPKDAPLRDLPELHPIMLAGHAEDPRETLAWACLPCTNRLTAAGHARRCIEQRG